VAGDEMDQEILAYARSAHNLAIGERMAEEIKMEAGSAYPLIEEKEVVLKGRDLVSGLPKSVVISSVELRSALSAPVSAIVQAVKDTIEVTPPELVADIMERGIVMAGGGSLLRGLDQRIAQETKFPVYVAEDPLTCVVRGAGEVLEELDRVRGTLVAVVHRKPPR